MYHKGIELNLNDDGKIIILGYIYAYVFKSHATMMIRLNKLKKNDRQTNNHDNYRAFE